MVRVITQETYDEVVKEMIEEFEMSPEEAIKEAIAQFQAQGVNLSNIIKDLALGMGDDHLVTTVVKRLKDLCSQKNVDDDAIVKEMDILKTECNKDIARRIKAGKDGLYNILIDLLQSKLTKYIQVENKSDETFIVNVLDTLIALMDTQPDLLDSRGVDLIKRLLDDTDSDDILIATYKWISACCFKHEINRQRIFGKNIASNIKLVLDTKKNVKLITESLQAIRRLTLDDDIRVQYGKAHEHARELGANLLPKLTQLLKENTKPPLVRDIMMTMVCLLVRCELCSMVAEQGAGVVFTVLADNYDSAPVIQQACKLITALAGNDDVKRELVRYGIVPIIVSVLTRHSKSAKTVALTLKCISALTLREPAHSQQFFDNDAPEVIVECMKVHQDDPDVQRNACWAIRNMVARSREHNAKFHELGVEAILKSAYDKFDKEFGFDVKSALRDLECDVKLEEQWTGKGVQLEK